MRVTSGSAQWICFATNLGLEILSLACDQASSARRPHYALLGMLLAIVAVLISIGELIYRGKKERVVLKRRGMLLWFYHPPLRVHTPFGTLPEIYGLVAGISQCICSTVQYVYLVRHADNPLKASLLPAIFLICLGGSRLTNNGKIPSSTESNAPGNPDLNDQVVEVQGLHDNMRVGKFFRQIDIRSVCVDLRSGEGVDLYGEGVDHCSNEGFDLNEGVYLCFMQGFDLNEGVYLCFIQGFDLNLGVYLRSDEGIKLCSNKAAALRFVRSLAQIFEGVANMRQRLSQRHQKKSRRVVKEE